MRIGACQVVGCFSGPEGPGASLPIVIGQPGPQASRHKVHQRCQSGAVGAHQQIAEGKAVMSQSKVVGAAAAGGATAASLPVTGSPVFAIIAAGVAMLVGGVLLVRAGRYQRSTV